jgi:hypothetical protein
MGLAVGMLWMHNEMCTYNNNTMDESSQYR